MSLPPLPEPVASKTWPQSLTGEPGFTVPLFTDDQMLAYAAQAVAEAVEAEREANAALCDMIEGGRFPDGEVAVGFAAECADAIRARSTASAT